MTVLLSLLLALLWLFALCDRFACLQGTSTRAEEMKEWPSLAALAGHEMAQSWQTQALVRKHLQHAACPSRGPHKNLTAKRQQC